VFAVIIKQQGRLYFVAMDVYFVPGELLAQVQMNVPDILCNSIHKGFMVKRYLTGMTVTLKYTRN
jgi:hypothetical protein